MANLPLVSSACGIVSSAYNSTKGSHPYVRSVCDAAEKGVRTLTAAAVSGAQPILTKLEPQSEWGSPQMWGWGALWGHTSEFFFSGGFLVSTANEYACKGLDKLEEKLPILQQPTEKVMPLWGRPALRGLLGQNCPILCPPGGGGDQGVGVVHSDGCAGSSERCRGNGLWGGEGRRGEDAADAELQHWHRCGHPAGSAAGKWDRHSAGEVGGADGALPAWDGWGAG